MSSEDWYSMSHLVGSELYTFFFSVPVDTTSLQDQYSLNVNVVLNALSPETGGNPLGKGNPPAQRSNA